ncbi:MAG: hypothetical protein EOS36_30090 [Mesorhizobium sp.]|nr:MAG: hypothetical protein EOS36_30090 [Mesorhizobium sp.]RWE33822.1 MAG: hypothetical protein EOS79_29275 [Mesorhizobium sp.]
MAFRFVHTADTHLDSPLRSLALRNPELAELVGDASRQAFALFLASSDERGLRSVVPARSLSSAGVKSGHSGRGGSCL